MPVPSSVFSARFAARVVERLEARSRRAGVPKSRLAERYVEEGMRMDDHPTIIFRPGPSGRRAALSGGPDIWEVIWVLRQSLERGGAAIDGTADWMNLSASQVRDAMRYHAEFTEEIDERIRWNEEGADEAEAAWLREQAALA